MEKFRFANPAPANPANRAKTVEYQGSCKAKALLKFAKDSTADISLATFSKPIANQVSTGTGGLAGLAALAGAEDSQKAKTPPQNSQNTQKEQIKTPKRLSGNFENALSKLKTTSTPPPDLSKIRPEHVQGYTATDPDRLKKIPGLPEDLFQAPAVWIREEEKTCAPDTCPCRCKRTGKYYGESYFLHKAGKSQNCQGDQCPWME